LRPKAIPIIEVDGLRHGGYAADLDAMGEEIVASRFTPGEESVCTRQENTPQRALQRGATSGAGLDFFRPNEESRSQYSSD
jgi:hypothetical protein